jgi:hypothetical protein
MHPDPQACDDARRTWWLETAPGSRFIVDTTPPRLGRVLGPVAGDDSVLLATLDGETVTIDRYARRLMHTDPALRGARISAVPEPRAEWLPGWLLLAASFALGFMSGVGAAMAQWRA